MVVSSSLMEDEPQFIRHPIRALGSPEHFTDVEQVSNTKEA